MVMVMAPEANPTGIMAELRNWFRFMLFSVARLKGSKSNICQDARTVPQKHSHGIYRKRRTVVSQWLSTSATWAKGLKPCLSFTLPGFFTQPLIREAWSMACRDNCWQALSTCPTIKQVMEAWLDSRPDKFRC